MANIVDKIISLGTSAKDTFKAVDPSKIENFQDWMNLPFLKNALDVRETKNGFYEVYKTQDLKLEDINMEDNDTGVVNDWSPLIELSQARYASDKSKPQKPFPNDLGAATFNELGVDKDMIVNYINALADPSVPENKISYMNADTSSIEDINADYPKFNSLLTMVSKTALNPSAVGNVFGGLSNSIFSTNVNIAKSKESQTYDSDFKPIGQIDSVELEQARIEAGENLNKMGNIYSSQEAPTQQTLSQAYKLEYGDDGNADKYAALVMGQKGKNVYDGYKSFDVVQGTPYEYQGQYYFQGSDGNKYQINGGDLSPQLSMVASKNTNFYSPKYGGQRDINKVGAVGGMVNIPSTSLVKLS